MVMGIDVSKVSVAWTLINKAGKVVREGTCENAIDPLKKLFSDLQQRYVHLVVGVESTGIYHLATVHATETCNLPCRLLNPIQTKQFTKSSIRGTKTDRTDARSIAKLTLEGSGHLVQPVDQSMSKARAYLRLAHHLQGVHTQIEALRQYITAPEVQLDASSLVNCQESVKTSVTYYRELAATLLKDNQAVTLLRSLPGIGPVTAMGIVTEIGTVKRFQNATKLIAYAGLDPRIKQSGQTSSNGRLTKRGSPYLRYYLFVAANIARQHDPELAEAYERRRKAGKSHTVANVAVARKLALRIYAVLKRRKPYEVTKDSDGKNIT